MTFGLTLVLNLDWFQIQRATLSHRKRGNDCIRITERASEDQIVEETILWQSFIPGVSSSGDAYVHSAAPSRPSRAVNSSNIILIIILGILLSLFILGVERNWKFNLRSVNSSIIR